MSKAKNQHIVPQFYLRHFASNEEKSQIFTYNKQNGKSFCASIKTTATRKLFYDHAALDEETGEQTLEKLLSRLEADISPHYQKLIDLFDKPSEKINLDYNDRSKIATFIALSLLRTEEARNRIHNTPIALKEALEKRGQKLSKELEEELLKEDGKVSQLKMILDNLHLNIGKAMMEKIWIFHINDTQIKYLTSDVPVYGYNDDKKKYINSLNLTPRISLTLIQKADYPELAPYDLHCTVATPDNVKWINFQTIYFANRSIISCENKFEHVEEVLIENPDFKKLNRTHFVIV